MKQKAPQKRLKKPNIPLRRKLAIVSSRFVIITKIIIILFFYLLFFTKYLGFIKQELAHYFYEYTADLGFKLENVLIEGQHNITLEEVLPILNADTGTPIFAIDISEIKKQIEKNPWVKAAAVERQLPKTIYIAILERTPIAIWQINQKLHLIDEDGYKITSKDIEKFSNLPHVVGTDANIYAAKLIEDLGRFPVLAQRVVSAVRYGERRWNLNLEQNIIIKMPEKDSDSALIYLNALNKAGKLFDLNYKSIDLRDSTKYYIEKY